MCVHARAQDGALVFNWTYPDPKKRGDIVHTDIYTFKPNDTRLPNGFSSNFPIHINITRFQENVRTTDCDVTSVGIEFQASC